jgi:hypothetical protein
MAAHNVVRRIDRAEPEVVAALGDAGVATVHEVEYVDRLPDDGPS